ncbi:hypothetical protein DM02DRAFT_215957 [Periconia macrospinosa]|uniref:Secreted protein n=1 Tax=Periconia macrospinosa TaxID=97972 RepID=A0A2V1D6K3_9PLEO|nr:hypothetical protein DM02DRAFT_215957 [Periconia macrospinosa]
MQFFGLILFRVLGISSILSSTISDLSLEYCVALFNFPQCETAQAGICSLTYYALVHHIANTVNGALESGVRTNEYIKGDLCHCHRPFYREGCGRPSQGPERCNRV